MNLKAALQKIGGSGRTTCLLAFYLIAHGFIIFIPDAVYWDDWFIYRMPSEEIISRFEQMNLPLNYVSKLHIFLVQSGVATYKYLTLILMFATGLLLDSILIRTFVASGKDQISAKAYSLVIVLLFLILPFNLARPLLIIFPYTLNYFIFFLAWYLIDKRTIIAAVLFMISFNVNSLLVFFAIPIIDLYFRKNHTIQIKGIVIFIKKYCLLIILPLVYFASKKLWFSPYGMYKGYNEDFNFLKVIKAPILQVANLFEANISLGLCALMLLVSASLINRFEFAANQAKTNVKLWILAGCVILIAGGFPYWLLGRVPTFNAWSSRHQLLMPLGAAVLLAGIILTRSSHSARKYLFIMIASVSLTYDIESYVSYYADWQKQKQLIALFKDNKEIEHASLIIFEDQSRSKNYQHREYAVHEWNGLLENAFGDQKRLGININETGRYLSGDLNWNIAKMFKAGDYLHQQDEQAVLVTIKDSLQDTRELGFKTDRAEKFSDQLLGWIRPKFEITTVCVRKNQDYRISSMRPCSK